MRDAIHRQLRALARTALYCTMVVRSFADAPSAPSVADELRAARLMQAALDARHAEPAEWRKLDAIYAELSAKHPRDAAVRNARGELLWDLGERERAMREWEAAEQLDATHATALHHLGGAHLASGDTKQSAHYFRRASDAAPTNPSYHYELANVLFLFRHDLKNATTDEAAVIDLAMKHYAEASRLAPLDTEYARGYAETFYSVPQADWNTALAAWGRLLDISPKKEFPLSNLVRVHIRMRQRDAAQACLDKLQSPDFEKLKSKLQEQINLLPAQNSQR